MNPIRRVIPHIKGLIIVQPGQQQRNLERNLRILRRFGFDLSPRLSQAVNDPDHVLGKFFREVNLGADKDVMLCIRKRTPLLAKELGTKFRRFIGFSEALESKMSAMAITEAAAVKAAEPNLGPVKLSVAKGSRSESEAEKAPADHSFHQAVGRNLPPNFYLQRQAMQDFLSSLPMEHLQIKITASQKENLVMLDFLSDNKNTFVPFSRFESLSKPLIVPKRRLFGEMLETPPMGSKEWGLYKLGLRDRVCLLIKTGRYEKALSFLKEWLSDSEEFSRIEETIQKDVIVPAMYLLAKASGMQGVYLDLLEKDPLELIRLMTLSYQVCLLEDFDPPAETIRQRMLAGLERVEGEYEKILARSMIARYLYKLGYRSEAYKHIDLTLETIETIESPVRKWLELADLAEVLREVGFDDLASNLFKRINKIIEDRKYSEEVFMACIESERKMTEELALGICLSAKIEKDPAPLELLLMAFDERTQNIDTEKINPCLSDDALAAVAELYAYYGEVGNSIWVLKELLSRLRKK